MVVHAPTAEPMFKAEVYPNPTRGQVTIHTDYDKGTVSVMMLNAMGQMVMYFTMDGERALDVSHLSPGVYTLQLLGGSIVTKKLVIK